MSREERELVERCRVGDELACRSVYGLHAGRVTAYFLRSGFAEADADDLAQDVFVRAFRALDTFDPLRGTLRQWLGAIARNVARRHWQKRRQGELFDAALAEETFAAPENPGESPQGREERMALTACIEALPTELAQVVSLRYVEARTTRGIAEATALPESTVRLRLSQAVEALMDCLKTKGFSEQA